MLSLICEDNTPSQDLIPQSLSHTVNDIGGLGLLSTLKDSDLYHDLTHMTIGLIDVMTNGHMGQIMVKVTIYPERQ